MWKALGVDLDEEGLYRELRARYSETHRRYHTLQHLEECFAELREARALAAHPAEVELALWFHDAVYDTRRDDNEEKSAAWAGDSALRAGLPRAVAARVHDLVLATRHAAVPEDEDARILVDIDLAILAAPAQRFDEYERQIREEYAWVPAWLFRRKRRKLLRDFLARPEIFGTAHFASREARARANLCRSLEALGARNQ